VSFSNQLSVVSIRLALALFLVSSGAGLQAGRDCLLVRGALGDPAFQEIFADMESAWRQAAEQAGDVRFQRLAAKAELKEALHKLPAESEELWIVLVGHGTDDGRTAKFNLEGEDVSAAELASWLASWTRPLVVMNSPLPAVPSYRRFRERTGWWSQPRKAGPKCMLPSSASTSPGARCPEADLDRDGAISVLEATVVAANRVAAEYAAGNQLASEHALVDDNGDGKGTRADWFEG